MSHLLDFIIKPDPDMDIDSILPDDINNMDIPLSFDNPELMTSDFFDSVLSMEKQNLSAVEDDLMNYEFKSNEDEQHSPVHTTSSENCSLDSDDFNFINDSNNISLHGTNDVTDVINGEEFLSLLDSQNLQKNINDILGLNNNTNAPIPQKVVIRQPNNTKKLIVSKPVNSVAKKTLQPGKKQVIRVQSISGNGRSLLLPVNVKNVKKFKIISTNELKLDNVKVLPQITKKVEKYAASTSSESVDEIDIDIENVGHDRSYPALELTLEEKRLLMKEGIKLPSHYPLSKNEEKELKRIRRKIRNKISAQDSRKRKKEYVDQLEEKARRTDEENEILKKRVKILNKENTRLHEQLKKLHDLLFSSTSKATPTTCLMIVLFSTLLVCLPNMRTANNKDLDIGEQQLISSARRALLFNPQSKEDDDSLHLEEFLVFNKEEGGVDLHFEEEDKENGTSAFIKYLGDLSKKYETLIRSNCTEILQGGSLQDFCKKHEEDFKLALQNLRSIMGSGNTEEKKFIEPDISDDEDDGPIFKHHNAYLLDDDDPPTKKMRISQEIIDYERKETKFLPLKKE